MIFPDTETGRGAGGKGGTGGEDCAEGQGKVAAVPAPLLRHRELQHDHQSVPVFFFLFCFTSASRAEPFKWYHPWFLFITNLITLQSAGAQQYFFKAA